MKNALLGLGALGLASGAYLGLSQDEKNLTIDNLRWIQESSTESLVKITKSDWAWLIDGSEKQINPIYQYNEISREKVATGREKSTWNKKDAELINIVSNKEHCDQETKEESKFNNALLHVDTEYTVQERCDKVTYTLQLWMPDHSSQITFGNDKEVKGFQVTSDTQRIIDRHTHYYAEFKDDKGKLRDTLISEADWNKFSTGMNCTAKVSFLLGVNNSTLDCK